MAVRGVPKGTPRLKGKTMTTTTVYTPIPVWIGVNFVSDCGCHATLAISANNAPSLTVSVIHEALLGVVAYDAAGNGIIEDLAIQDRETLTFLVRNSISEIIAIGVFEVDLSLTEKLSAVLQPKLSSNLLVDQCERRVVDSATNRAMTTLEVEELAEVTQ